MPEELDLQKYRMGKRATAQARPGRRTPRQLIRVLIPVLLVAILSGPGFAFAQNQKTKKGKEKKDPQADVTAASLLSDNQGIDLLVSQMLGAWQAGDVEGMHKFYADDVMVISGAWEPPLFGWANYAKAYQTQFARSSGARLERTNSYVKTVGDAAVVAYQWQFVGDVDGKRTQALGHTTLFLEKRAGNWLITVNHTSAVPTDDLSTQTSSPAGQPTSALAPSGR
jgi:uncharacterized protein (TIGR02246 family)